MSESRALTVGERLSAIPAFAMAEGELIATLSDSIYPGGKPGSIKMVVNYCKANVLDPFQKPVHIVPMSRKVGKKDNGKDEYADVDTIMPGIGLYRVQAVRTGEHAGTSEPEFGPMKEFKFKEEFWEEDERGQRVKHYREATVEYPEWCKVVVTRRHDGHDAIFASTEYWLENYATAGRYTTAPNAMWKKRPRGQLAKCAEAQALRKGFPELGSAPTADEMEGKWIDAEGAPTAPPARPAGPQSNAEAAKANVIDVDTTTGEILNKPNGKGNGHDQEPQKESPPASDGMLKLIRAKLADKNLDEIAFCKEHGHEALAGITFAQGNVLLMAIAKIAVDAQTKANA